MMADGGADHGRAEVAPASGSPADPPPEELSRLDPRAITLWRAGYLLRGGMFTLLALGAELVFAPPLPTGLLTAAVAAAAVLVAVVIPPVRHRAWAFRVRSADVYLRHGVLVRTTSLVPHARIQHVDTRHGPLDRCLGLAELVIFTAGTRGAILSIPALDARTAEGLRDRLAALSGAGDAV